MLNHVPTYPQNEVGPNRKEDPRPQRGCRFPVGQMRIWRPE